MAERRTLPTRRCKGPLLGLPLPTNESSTSPGPSDCPRALQNHIVIRNIFNYLCLEDIKSCREVCKAWGQASQLLLRKRSQLSFNYSKKLSISSRELHNYVEDFKDSQIMVPFSALKLTKDEKSRGQVVPWPTGALKDIFQDWEADLQELTIDSIQFEDHPLNISNLLQKVTNITKIEINLQTSVKINPLEISLEAMPLLKYVCVSGCKLKLNAHIINPIEIEIKKTVVEFPMEDGDKILNKYFNFSRLEKFTFNSRDGNEKFDLTGYFELKSLHLEGLSVLNWNTSHWRVNKLHIPSTSWTGKSTIHVIEMNVGSYGGDITDVPDMVERLDYSVFCNHLAQLRGVTNPHLPNLKYLDFSSCQAGLNLFQSCSQLTSLRLRYITTSRQGTHLCVSSIPPQIRHLAIHDSIAIRGTWTNPPLEKLILYNCPLCMIKANFKKFEAKEVVVKLIEARGKYLGVKTFLSSTGKRVTIGPFLWTAKEFAASEFSGMVDRFSKYYSFENNIGVAISERKFNEEIDL